MTGEISGVDRKKQLLYLVAPPSRPERPRVCAPAQEMSA
jgi:hypothetical protein